MILNILFYVVLLKAQDLVPGWDVGKFLGLQMPNGDGEKYFDVLSSLQLLEIFMKSEGIVQDLPDGAFSATNEWDSNHGPIYCRIGADRVAGKAHGWVGSNAGESAITVDMTTSQLVTGVATQGRGDADQWVTDYSVQTSENGYDWVDLGNFVGNFDRSTICKVRFTKPVLARFVKFTVLKFNAHKSMRLDVLVYNFDNLN